jgi:hypothetical protein
VSASAVDSIHATEFNENEIDESDSQFNKHNRQQISIFKNAGNGGFVVTIKILNHFPN